jgi:hypothetical protein
VQAIGDGHSKPVTEPVGNSAEATPPTDDAPPVAGQDDVDPSPPEQRSLVETVYGPAWELRLCAHLEHRAERRRAPERQFELRRLVEREPAEAAHLNRHGNVELPVPRGGRDDDLRPLCASNLAPQDAVVEPLEPSASPPPAAKGEQARRRGDAAPGRGDSERPCHPEARQRRFGRQPNDIRERDAETQRAE